MQRRLKFCCRETQLKWFERQLELSKRWRLPLFLHMRAASADLLAVLRANPESFRSGVVHSFDGTLEEAQQVLSIPGLRIGEAARTARTVTRYKHQCAVVLASTPGTLCEQGSMGVL